MINALITSFMLLLLIACKAQGISQSEASNISNRLVSERMPWYNLVILTPVVDDTKETWTVTYRGPPDSFGGSPTVIINKNTGEVIDYSGSQ